MAGKPLIYYSISACLNTREIDQVSVTTDDEEIALFARRFGAHVIMRPAQLAADSTTLDPVIRHAHSVCEEEFAALFGIIITVQPTSPLINEKYIGGALEMLVEEELDTVLSVVDDRHLRWTIQEGKRIPEYHARVNRQFLPPSFRETGAIIACRSEVLCETGSRIGSKVGLLEIEQEKSFDIDTISDFMICENLLLRKRILFRVIGNQSVGMGHVYRALMLANELVAHNLMFLCTEEHTLASDFIAERNFNVKVCSVGTIVQEIKAYEPDLVINDILDTEAEYICKLKDNNIPVINFEDIGSGIEYADVVINALYPPSKPLANVKSGADYFCLRDEFIHRGPASTEHSQNNVLLCFGGVDEGNLSLRVLNAIYPECKRLNVDLTIILGMGYMHLSVLEEALSHMENGRIELVTATSAISDYMQRAMFAFTSGGRTVFELASMCTPTIVICQNDRELTHSFGSRNVGVINLGHRIQVSDHAIVNSFRRLATQPGLRDDMARDLAKNDFSGGKSRVMSLIRMILETSDD